LRVRRFAPAESWKPFGSELTAEGLKGQGQIGRDAGRLEGEWERIKTMALKAE